jgi:hypothetical protein
MIAQQFAHASVIPGTGSVITSDAVVGLTLPDR